MTTEHDDEPREASPENAAKFRRLQAQLSTAAARDRADNLAAMTMIRAAEAGYRSADSFAGWFIAGTAALVGLLVANLDKLDAFIPVATIKAMVPLLVIAFALVLVAKYLGSLIAAKAASRQAAVDQMREWEERGMPTVLAEDFLAAQRRACPWWINLLRDIGPKSSIDLARRTMTQLSIASLCILAAALLVGWIWWTLATSLTSPPSQSVRPASVPSTHEQPRPQRRQAERAPRSDTGTVRPPDAARHPDARRAPGG